MIAETYYYGFYWTNTSYYTEKNTIQQDDPDSRFATGDRTAPFEIDPKTDGDPSKSDKSKQNGGP